MSQFLLLGPSPADSNFLPAHAFFQNPSPVDLLALRWNSGQRRSDYLMRQLPLGCCFPLPLRSGCQTPWDSTPSESAGCALMPLRPHPAPPECPDGFGSQFSRHRPASDSAPPLTAPSPLAHEPENKLKRSTRTESLEKSSATS